MKKILWKVSLSALAAVFIFMINVSIEIRTYFVIIFGLVVLLYFWLNLEFKSPRIKNKIRLITLLSVIYYEVLIDILKIFKINAELSISILSIIALILLLVASLYILKEMPQCAPDGRSLWRNISRLEYVYLIISAVSIVSFLFVGSNEILYGQEISFLFIVLIIFSLPIKLEGDRGAIFFAPFFFYRSLNLEFFVIVNTKTLF